MRTANWLLCLVLAMETLGNAQIQSQAPPPAPAIALPVVRQGNSSSTMSDVQQKIMFVKSDTSDPKAAIANVLLSDVGIHLLTMGLIPGLRWNPYMNDAVTKAARLGKGKILSHSNDVKGFEFDTLPGLTAATTLKSDKIDIEIPLDTYRPSADFQVDGIEPVLLRLETRPKDQVRILASRRVSIREQKKGRFDLKPTSLREESDVQEQTIPIQVERQSGNILHIGTCEALPQGEYALVLRAKAETGAPTQNIPLKPGPAPAAATPPTGPMDPMAAMMGRGGMMPPPQQPQHRSPFGFGKPAPPRQDPVPAQGGAGFLAWDFRVIQ
jgi:hypothetical protein